MTPHQSELIRLRNRVEDLEYELREIKKTTDTTAILIANKWGLARIQAHIVAVLFAAPNGILSRSALFHRVYGPESDIDPETLKVHLCRIRKKFAPDGIRIDTVWAQGLRIPPDSRSKIRAAIEAPEMWMRAG